MFPPAPEPANVAFSKLTKIPFPGQDKANLSFSLETAEGTVPQFPSKTNVYFMPKRSANLLSLDYARENAARLGFNQEAQQMSDSLYKFNHKTTVATLEYDIITGSFSVSFDLNADPSPLSIKPLQPEIASATIRSFLSAAGLLPDDLKGLVKHQFLKTQAGKLVPALSLSDSNLVRVDLFRSNYNDLPIVTSSPNESNVWFTVSGLRDRGKDIIAGEYHYFAVDESLNATYPLKTGDAAWQEFQSGNYYPASLGSTIDGENIKIRKIYLAYYDAGIYTEFLQPVYVFEGDKNFVGYVPAVTTDYYGE